jgi:hypothetical protein
VNTDGRERRFDYCIYQKIVDAVPLLCPNTLGVNTDGRERQFDNCIYQKIVDAVPLRHIAFQSNIPVLSYAPYFGFAQYKCPMPHARSHRNNPEEIQPEI